MFPQLGILEMLVVMLVAVLLFGKRLPEVGRSLGKGIVEFKKGLRGVEDDFDTPAAGSSSSHPDLTRLSDDSGMISVPKFEPPTSAPTPHSAYEPQSHPQ